ncbi:MAG: hypothetical protein ACJAUZ_002395 [Flavobacteriaceae bacterium]|jgi:hypothetical protein
MDQVIAYSGGLENSENDSFLNQVTDKDEWVRVQSTCDHHHVGEAADTPFESHGLALMVRRVCVSCGLTEDAIEGKFKILVVRHPYRFTRSETEETRIGEIIFPVSP